MAEQITVTEYMENNDLLKIYYTPYDRKVDIVNAILDQMVFTTNDVAYVDRSILLKVADMVFIGTATNIDMMATDEDGLDGFDKLSKEGLLDSIIEIIDSEYSTFNYILDARIDVIEKTQTGIPALINAIDKRVTEIGESINHIDAQSVGEFVTTLIKDNVAKFGKS